MYKKSLEKQQPEQLMKEAVKALNVHWQCSAVHREQVKSLTSKADYKIIKKETLL